LRRSLVEEEKARKASEDAKRLARQADEIAKVINEDFRDFRQRVAKVRAKARGAVDPQKLDLATQGEDDLIFGGDEPATIVGETGDFGATGANASGGEEPRTLAPEVEPGPPDGPSIGRRASRSTNRTKPSRGGFDVDFRKMGEGEIRATYERDSRT